MREQFPKPLAEYSSSRGVKGRCRCDGFTLIEILVALVILSTGLVAVLRAFETSLSALRDSRETMLVEAAAGTYFSALRIAAQERGGGHPYLRTAPPVLPDGYTASVVVSDAGAEVVDDASEARLTNVRLELLSGTHPEATRVRSLYLLHIMQTEVTP